MKRFNIKQNDTSPELLVKLLDENGEAKTEIANVDTINFYMMDQSETTIVSGTATVINADEGKVAYEWSESDTSQSGKFKAEFEVKYSSNGGIETFPNDGYINVLIDEDIE